MELLLRPTEFEHDGLPDMIPADAQHDLYAMATEVRTCEEPLFAALKQHFPHRFPRVCGPATIALGHILSERTQVAMASPDDHHAPYDRLMLHTSVFNLEQLPEWPPIDEHTWLQYRRVGYSLAIDPTIRLQHGAPAGPGATRIEWYENHHVQSGMREEACLYLPLSGNRQQTYDLWGTGGPSDRTAHDDLREIMHDRNVFAKVTQASSGRRYAMGKYWGMPLRRVIYDVLEELG